MNLPLRRVFCFMEVGLPENVILYANKHGLTRLLANYAHYKSVYRSAHFHSKQAPECLKITRSTFHNHIEALIDQGWAERLDKGFRLVSVYKISQYLKNLHRDYKCVKKHHFTNGSKSDLVSQLRYITLKRKHRQIDFRDTANRLDIKYTKGDKINKVAKKLITDGLSGNVSMSIKTIGKTWNMSTTTGHRFKKRWEAEGNINVTSQQPELYRSNVSWREFQCFRQTEYYNQTLFHSGTNIWQSQSDKIQCYV